MADQKAIVQKWLGFINMASIFKTLARMPGRKNRPFFIFDDKTYTYKEVYEESLKYAKYFLTIKEKKIKQGKLKPEDQMAIGLYLDNCPEFVFIFFGAAMAGAVLIAANTGFRGETLSNLMNLADVSLLISDTPHLEEIGRILPDVTVIGDEDVFIVGDPAKTKDAGYKNIEDGIASPEVTNYGKVKVKVDTTSPLIVIYTSGTTGAPKGVPCSQIKLLGAAIVTYTRLKLKKEDRGWISMPMFHSNAWFIGILPLMLSGSSFLLRRKFSASGFVDDMLNHGITYLNYVGQPIHYIIVALENKHGSPEDVEKALADHPDNHFRIAHGNGATPVDRQKLMRYLNMEHIYELYGSTEASISTVICPGDPIDSVGLCKSKKVVILNENNENCPPGEVDEKGGLLNYDAAVGEISKITDQNNIIFDGYYKNTDASSKKFQDGYFRSGDLGHIRIVNGKKYLYFNGRTDDWIRKDGENFSAENVAQFAFELPGVELAAAYGAPCEVADEKVMIAIQLKSGVDFDPKAVFDWFMEQQKTGGMDPKWMPDYIRIVDSFSMTHQTQKILVRPLKREHFNLEKVPEMKSYYRQRGDDIYNELTEEAFKELRTLFDEAGRKNVLYAGL